MQATSTRVVMFEMCGNDYLQARSNLSDQTGTCNFGVLDTALANCTTYMEKGMQAINQYATSAKVKVIANIYYPGYDADNTQTKCGSGSGSGGSDFNDSQMVEGKNPVWNKYGHERMGWQISVFDPTTP